MLYDDVVYWTGSLPEEEQGKYYNTCTIFNPEGKFIAKYRKVPILFDCHVINHNTRETDWVQILDKFG